jgi:hypothetical protein
MASPDRYKKLYFDSDQSYALSNSGLDYGSIFADALEHSKETGNILTDTALELLPKYDVRDKEISVDLKTKDGWVTLLGRPDMLDSETLAFREVKTGRVKWTQSKADKHMQLKFYAVMIYQQHKVVPPSIFLDWVETAKNEVGEVEPTGHIESFEVVIKLKDILEMCALISRVVKEIELAWVTYEPEPEEPF